MALKGVRLKPDFSSFKNEATAASVTSLVRAALAAAIAFRSNFAPVDVVYDRWPSDDGAGVILRRSASSPASMVDPSDAALLTTLVADYLRSLGPISAAAQLIEQSLQLRFDGAAFISLPALVADASNAAWVDENMPIPVKQLSIASPPPMLLPKKLGVIALLSRELIEHSNAEVLISDVLRRSVGLGLDAAVLDSNPADTTRPAGIRYGTAALAASEAADPWQAMLQDVGAVAGAVSSVGGNMPVCIIAAPQRAMIIRLRAGQPLPFTLLASRHQPGDAGHRTAAVLHARNSERRGCADYEHVSKRQRRDKAPPAGDVGTSRPARRRMVDAGEMVTALYICSATYIVKVNANE
jgi:hypothetical protein